MVHALHRRSIGEKQFWQLHQPDGPTPRGDPLPLINRSSSCTIDPDLIFQLPVSSIDRPRRRSIDKPTWHGVLRAERDGSFVSCAGRCGNLRPGCIVYRKTIDRCPDPVVPPRPASRHEQPPSMHPCSQPKGGISHSQ